MHLTIASLADIQHAQQLNRWFNRPTVDDVVVNIDLKQGEKQVLQTRLKILFNDCGCFWGPPAFLVCFLGLLIPQYMQTGFSWTIIGVSFLIAVVGAAAAKFVALYVSHIRLKKKLELIEKLILGAREKH